MLKEDSFAIIASIIRELSAVGGEGYQITKERALEEAADYIYLARDFIKGNGFWSEEEFQKRETSKDSAFPETQSQR